MDIRNLTKLYNNQISKIFYDDGLYRGPVEEIHYKNGDYKITANGKNYRGKWKTFHNQICYKQNNWIEYKCALVYAGYNDGMKL